MSGKKPSGGGKSSAFMKPLQPDEALADIVGSEPIPRTEVTKRIWDYIREHNLQDPSDKRQIRADDKLRKIFDGKDQVSMFELTKLVSQHLK
ncbi:MAG TPA: SWIB/MDM2 domain-containing protein [Blastocatellia bacterium]|nr:SWIB/MDM2 domain-containing protein [Blastocatellia bacterium]